MGRKNWLFSNTPSGAQSSTVIYSLVETAREAGLDPYRYLLWVFRTAPTLAVQDKDWAEKLIPAAAPIYCYVPGKKEEAISSKFRNATGFPAAFLMTMLWSFDGYLKTIGKLTVERDFLQDCFRAVGKPIPELDSEK